jgi:hypothetical protein
MSPTIPNSTYRASPCHFHSYLMLAISFTALIDGQDVVLWYAGHLGHRAAEGGDEWHGVGPALAPFRNWW